MPARTSPASIPKLGSPISSSACLIDELLPWTWACRAPAPAARRLNSRSRLHGPMDHCLVGSLLAATILRSNLRTRRKETEVSIAFLKSALTRKYTPGQFCMNPQAISGQIPEQSMGGALRESHPTSPTMRLTPSSGCNATVSHRPGRWSPYQDLTPIFVSVPAR